MLLQVSQCYKEDQGLPNESPFTFATTGTFLLSMLGQALGQSVCRGRRSHSHALFRRLAMLDARAGSPPTWHWWLLASDKGSRGLYCS